MGDIPVYDKQVLKLTQKFYNDYPFNIYKELMEKKNRSYNCLLLQTNYEYFICIPYRSEISHKYAFKFTSTKRSIQHKSGLDYSKIVIVQNPDYIDTKDSMVDKDEYNETVINLDTIVSEASDYIQTYIDHVTGVDVLHYRDFQRRYGFSTLKYFHKELGISGK